MPSGSATPTAPPTKPLTIKIAGTNSISLVEVIRDGVVIYSTSPGQREISLNYLDREASVGEHQYYVRVRQGDGMLAWSSPMFVGWKG